MVTASGHLYTMGCNKYGQLGVSSSNLAKAQANCGKVEEGE
jgi:hypothetical protein